MNDLVVYDNNLAELPLKRFSMKEMDLFMAICSKCRDKGSEPIVIPFNKLKAVSKYEAKDKKRFVHDIRSMNSKLLSLNMSLRENDKPGTTVQFNLFRTFITSEEDKTLTVEVDERFAYLLNALTSNFTQFELEEFVRLDNPYAKRAYRHMKRFRNTGIWIISADKFREIMEIPEGYKQTNINNAVLKPIEKELGPIFADLTIEKNYDSMGKRGRPAVTEYIFRWNKDGQKKQEEYASKSSYRETGFKCPYCEQPLYEKVINGDNCWCHIDGWKDDAICKRIYKDPIDIREDWKRLHPEPEEVVSEEEQQRRNENIKRITGLIDGLFGPTAQN